MNIASGLFIPSGRIQHFQPSLSASAKSLTDEPDRKRRLKPAEETLNDMNEIDPITGGGRQAIQMAIRRRQRRPSHRHTASMAAC